MSRLDIDPYVALGVSTDSSLEEIKAAYRRSARRLHPDVNNNPGANVQFQDITVAHDLLSDSDRRRAYDEQVIRQKAKYPNDFYFSLRVTPSKRTVARLQEPQVVYLLAEVQADPRARQRSEEHTSELQSRENLVCRL